MTPVAYAAAVFEDLENTRVLCIGDASSLVRQFNVCESIEVADGVPEELERFDIVVTGVGARKPVICAERLRRALRARRRKPIVLVELVPGDVEHAVMLLEDVYLWTL